MQVIIPYVVVNFSFSAFSDSAKTKPTVFANI